MVQEIQLESLLNPEANVEDYDAVDLEDATLECAEIAEDICTLESNLTTFEAAKMIKRAKSAKKSKKIVTSKMKAREAKDLKAKKGKKVLKITKEDEATDGGTGPLPTTSDTNGLTDTDLDAAPDEVVSVTQVSDDEATPADTSVGTEGVDFVTEYEDAKVVTLEAEEKEVKKSLWERIKDWVRAIGRWIASAIAKIVSVFRDSEKYYTAHKDQIQLGLTQKTVNTYKFAKNPKDIVSSALSGVNKTIDFANGAMKARMAHTAAQGTYHQGSLFSTNLWANIVGHELNKTAKDSDVTSDELFADLVSNGKSTDKVQKEGLVPGEAGFKLDTFEYFATKFDKDLKAVKDNWKKVERAVNEAAKDDENLKPTKDAVRAANKVVTKTFSACSRIGSNVINVMFQLGGTKEKNKD